MLTLYISLICLITGFLTGIGYARSQLETDCARRVRAAERRLCSELADRKAHELALLAEVDDLKGTVAWYRDRHIFGKEAGDAYTVTFTGADR